MPTSKGASKQTKPNKNALCYCVHFIKTKADCSRFFFFMTKTKFFWIPEEHAR